MDRRPTQSGHSHDVSHSRDRFAGRPVEETVDIFTKLDRANSRPDDRALVRGTESEDVSSPVTFPTVPNYPPPSWTKHAPERLQQQNNEQLTTTQPSNDQLKNKVVDAIHDPSLSTKDITIRIGLPIEQDISLDLESFCRLRREGRFSAARKVYESKLVQHSTAPYILVQYAEMLVVSGNYKGFHELIYPEESVSAADHNLEINFALLKLVAHSETRYTTNAMKTVLSVINSMKGTQLVGSTEIQIFSLCLQIMCYLKAAVHEDVVSEAVINAKTVFEWKSLHLRLLGEARIWDFRDILVGAASLFGWEEISFMLFGSKTLDQVLNMIHQDWLQTGDDEATVLGLLDIFTSLILHGRPLDPTRQPSLSSFARHARVLAEMAQKNNPDNMNTRPFIQWILAKTVIEMTPVPKRPDGVTLQNFMGLLDQGDEIQLPVFVPLWHSFKPGWGMVSARSKPAQRTAVEVALGAAMQGDDFHLQALALKILCLQSQDPSNLLDALLALQLKTQGDHDGFLRTWLAKYLIADTSTDPEALLETLAQSMRFVDSSKRYHMANPSLVWAKEVIKDHLWASVSGKELQAPNWGDWFSKHGQSLPQYIVDFIIRHYHLGLPSPTRASFKVPEEKNRNLWEGKQPEPDVDGDDDWGYDGGGSHDGTGAMDEERHGNTPVRRSIASRARINEPFHGHRGHDQIQRLRSPDRNRSPNIRPPPGPVIPPSLVRRASPSNHRGRRGLSPSTVEMRSPSPERLYVRRPSFTRRQGSLSSSSDHSWGRFPTEGEGQRESLESKIKSGEDGHGEEIPDPRRCIKVRSTRWHDDSDDSMVTHDDNAYHTWTVRDGHIKVGVDRTQHKVRFVESRRPQLGSKRVRDERPDNTLRSSGDRCGDIGYSTQVPKSVHVDNYRSELLFSSKILKDNTVTVLVRNRKDLDKVARYEIESTGILDTTSEDEMPTPTTVSGRLNQRDPKAEVREQQAVPSQQKRYSPRSTSSGSASPDLESTLSMSAWMKSRTLNQNHSSGPSQPNSTSHDSNTLNDTEVERPEYVTTKKQDLARSTAKSQILPGGRSSRVSEANKRAESSKGEETQNEWPTVDAEERPGYTNETSSSLSEKALNELNADSTGRQQRRRNSNTIAAIASNEEAMVVNDDTNNGLSVDSRQKSESGDGVDEDLAKMHQVPKPLSRRPTVQDDSDDDFIIRCRDLRREDSFCSDQRLESEPVKDFQAQNTVSNHLDDEPEREVDGKSP